MGKPLTPEQRSFKAAFRRYLEQQGLSETTVKLYSGRAVAILRARQTPAQWLQSKVGRGAPKGTVVSYRSTARHLYEFLRTVAPDRKGEKPDVDMKRVVKKTQLRLNAALDQARLKTYVQAVISDKSITPSVQAILLLLPLTGLRVGEMCSLRQDNLVNRGSVKCIHVVRGKGGKERFVPLGKRAKQVLQRYLSKHRQRSPWLFPSPTQPGKSISPGNVRDHHRRIRTRLGPDWESFRVHDLRHTFASMLIEKGVPIESVKDLLGHESVTTTEGYVHSNATALRGYVDLL